ncbi:MarR family winged helix-turn-helix transcriptional regulator [Mesorhizobium sp. 1B3]|uniref:MarR family winged helix-turn-helix transcriptional regulator n=1 Tax=Mesorhizobium sp. 1B3 TaxID=3243599 RepID=UPI003D9600B0
MRPKTERFGILEEVAKVSRKIRTLFDARVRAKGLTLARARTLLRIARCEASNQKALAEELEIETATLVRIIDGLEAQGLIQRKEVQGDRRAKQVVLTKEGLRLSELVDELAQQIEGEVLAGIDKPDLRAALGTLRRMVSNTDALASRFGG